MPPEHHTIWLPSIYQPTSPVDACGMSVFAQEFLDLWRAHPDQRRTVLVCHPIVQQVAQVNAQIMWQQTYFSHIGLTGDGPNQRLRDAGYVLPSDYPNHTANSVESIARDYFTPTAALAALVKSPAHRAHLLGEHPFFAAQTQCGIGFAGDPDRPHVYWCIVSAPPVA